MHNKFLRWRIQKKMYSKISASVCKDLKWAVLDQNTRHHAHSQTSGYVRHNKRLLKKLLFILTVGTQLYAFQTNSADIKTNIWIPQWHSEANDSQNVGEINWTLDIKYLSNNWKIRLIFTAEDLVVAAPEVCSFGRSAVDLIPVSSQNKPEERKTLHNFSHSILHIQSYW